MEAHVSDAAAHAHPGPAVYLKIALILFLVTILEVATYEVSHRGGAMETVIQPILIPILLVLSAIKFALVAMYYMHLKVDHKLFSGLFVGPLIVAGVIAVSLMVLISYHMHYNVGLV